MRPLSIITGHSLHEFSETSTLGPLSSTVQSYVTRMVSDYFAGPEHKWIVHGEMWIQMNHKGVKL